MKKRKSLVLLSGGLDSTVLTWNLVKEGHEVSVILFDYGQKHIKELEYAQSTAKFLSLEWTRVKAPCSALRSTLTNGVGSVVVPNRNAIMLSIACAYAESNGIGKVYFGANKDDAEMFHDCRRGFVNAFNSTLSAARLGVSVKAPFINLTKREVVGLGKYLGVDFDQTWTCYAGLHIPCGECSACKTRIEAMR